MSMANNRNQISKNLALIETWPKYVPEGFPPSLSCVNSSSVALYISLQLLHSKVAQPKTDATQDAKTIGIWERVSSQQKMNIVVAVANIVSHPFWSSGGSERWREEIEIRGKRGNNWTLLRPFASVFYYEMYGLIWISLRVWVCVGFLPRFYGPNKSTKKLI